MCSFFIRLEQASYVIWIKPDEVYEEVRVSYILRVFMRQVDPKLWLLACYKLQNITNFDLSSSAIIGSILVDFSL